jgi:crossover junction endodeoxyribonuclease RusA
MTRAETIVPLTFTLPLPPQRLSPNVRSHWAPKGKAVSEYRAAARTAGWRVPASQRPAWERATASVVFYAKDARRRDADNILASLKAAFDGLVDAGILADDAGLTHAPLRIALDRLNPRVEITISPHF